LCARRSPVISRISGAGLGENAFLVFFFTAFAFAAALVSGLSARRYPTQDFHRIA